MPHILSKIAAVIIYECFQRVLCFPPLLDMLMYFKVDVQYLLQIYRNSFLVKHCRNCPNLLILSKLLSKAICGLLCINSMWSVSCLFLVHVYTSYIFISLGIVIAIWSLCLLAECFAVSHPGMDS